MAKRKIEIMDTTLRDGEQTSGVSFSVSEKLTIAKLLIEELKVDRLEIASARVSEGEFEAVKNVTAWAAKNGYLHAVEVLSFVDKGVSIDWIIRAGGGDYMRNKRPYGDQKKEGYKTYDNQFSGSLVSKGSEFNKRQTDKVQNDKQVDIGNTKQNDKVENTFEINKTNKPKTSDSNVDIGNVDISHIDQVNQSNLLDLNETNADSLIKNEFLLKTDNVQIKPAKNSDFLETQAAKKKSPEEEFMEDFKGLCDNPADMNLYLEKMNAGKLPDTDQHINEILNAMKFSVDKTLDEIKWEKETQDMEDEMQEYVVASEKRQKNRATRHRSETEVKRDLQNALVEEEMIHSMKET